MRKNRFRPALVALAVVISAPRVRAIGRAEGVEVKVPSIAPVALEAPGMNAVAAPAPSIDAPIIAAAIQAVEPAEPAAEESSQAAGRSFDLSKEAGALAAAHVHQPQALNDLLNHLRNLAAQGKSPFTLFDLDDTLMNTSGRNHEIAKLFARQPEMRSAEFRVDSAKLLKASRALRDMPFNIDDVAKGAGIADPDFLKKLDAFWNQKFFSNKLIPFDAANPGAVDYVKAVIAAGGTAVYFTGRAQNLMPGTIAGLRKNGFPIPGEDPGARIVLKKDLGQSDAQFKGAQIKAWVEASVPIAGGFDNEPANIDAFQTNGPKGAVMIFVDTKHSNTPVAVAPGIPWVRNFIRPPARD